MRLSRPNRINKACNGRRRIRIRREPNSQALVRGANCRDRVVHIMIHNQKENQKMSTKNVDKLYDVVIVGGGIAGAILAKTLVNAGKKVLILEAGDGVTPSEEPNGLELGSPARASGLSGIHRPVLPGRREGSQFTLSKPDRGPLARRA